jgi:uncharacterized OsmC-like protein
MGERSFQMRLFSRYEGSENTVADLQVECLEDGEWEHFDLSIRSPGFLIFTYAALTCQHLYLRTNATERGLLIESSEGSIHLITTEDWNLQRLHVRFDVKLTSGNVTTSDVDYIKARMKQCPVSKIIKDVRDVETVVSIV